MLLSPSMIDKSMISFYNSRMTEVLKAYNDSQGAEQTPSMFRILNILELTHEQKTELKKSIKKQGGRLDILVHPYYNETSSDYDGGATLKYMQERDGFIKAMIAGGKPLVIFQDDYNEIRSKTADIQSGTLYVVWASSNYLKFSSNKLADLLRRMGVIDVTVGGRYLYFADDSKALRELAELKEEASTAKPHALEWLNANRLPFGCPAIVAIELLKRGFDVSLSPISSPAVLNHPFLPSNS